MQNLDVLPAILPITIPIKYVGTFRPIGRAASHRGRELNKLASNVSQGRNIAEVHWRSDATESNELGEAAAISILRDMRRTYNEPFNGFTLTKFDGTTVTV